MTHNRLTAVPRRHRPGEPRGPAVRPHRASDEVARAARVPQTAPRLPLLRSILVPVDGTPEAEHALPFALALARRSGAEVMLANVYSAPQGANDPERLGWRGGEYLVEPLREYLDGLTKRVTGAGPVRARPVLLRGYWPEDALCEFGDWGSDLVVVAARRRGWWSRFRRGSVSAEVARRSRAPVLVVPAGGAPPDLSAEPPLGRVLVPLDGSRGAERALGPAAALATLSEGGCDLLHVVRSRPYAVDWSLAFGGPPTGTPTVPTRDARCYLRGVAGRLRDLSLPARWQVVTDERPTAEAIARHAGLIGADVIAMASRGGVGLAGVFRGSLAARVSRLASVPVLVCRTT